VRWVIGLEVAHGCRQDACATTPVEVKDTIAVALRYDDFF